MVVDFRRDPTYVVATYPQSASRWPTTLSRKSRCSRHRSARSSTKSGTQISSRMPPSAINRSSPGFSSASGPSERAFSCLTMMGCCDWTPTRCFRLLRRESSRVQCGMNETQPSGLLSLLEKKHAYRPGPVVGIGTDAAESSGC